MTLWLCGLAIAITSAIWTKEQGQLPGLAGIETPAAATDGSSVNLVVDSDARAPVIEPVVATPIEPTPQANEPLDPSTRWFDGREIRPSKVIYMTVTGYSPDARSCGKYADNKTAIMYSVWTNGMNLVAADPTVLPYWSMVSIPGYANNDIVPVLDCGGAIKGNRLDLLYPTHEMARQWGVRSLPVTVWDFVEKD